MSCAAHTPVDQRQLVYKYGGRYGGANCTACEAGYTGDGHTCGAMLFTGSQVRAASNEPIPDPASPGLNLGQVDAALYRLSHGAIDLDSHYRYAWDAYRTRVIGGVFALTQVRRSVLIRHGFGGNNTFPGGHAVTIRYRGKWLMHDPLIGEIEVTEAAVKEASGALVLGPSGDICGFGFVYVAFSRDVVPNYHVSIAAGATFVYTFRDGMIWSRERTTFRKDTGANCNPVRRFMAHPSGPLKGTASRRLAVLSEGSRKGKAVQEPLPGKPTHVTIREV